MLKTSPPLKKKNVSYSPIEGLVLVIGERAENFGHLSPDDHGKREKKRRFQDLENPFPGRVLIDNRLIGNRRIDQSVCSYKQKSNIYLYRFRTMNITLHLFNFTYKYRCSDSHDHKGIVPCRPRPSSKTGSS